MLVSLTRKEHLFHLVAEIPVIVKYSHNAILDNVGHKCHMEITHVLDSHCLISFDLTFLLISRNKIEMLHLKSLFLEKYF